MAIMHTPLYEFPVHEILPTLATQGPRYVININGQRYEVKRGSHRYKTFANNLSCVVCSRTGNVMVLEQCDDKSTHFNLYFKGNKVGYSLMTMDHKIPVSKGGVTTLENLQTMCANCNCHLKGNRMISVEELRAEYRKKKRGNK